MQPKYTINDSVHHVSPIRRANKITLEVDGHRLDVCLRRTDRHQGEITVNGSPHQFYAAQDGNSLFIHIDGKVWHLDAHDEFGDSTAGSASEGRVSAPMPGVVVEIFTREGDSVTAGTTVMLIESMKLQTEIKAGLSGVVAAVGVEIGGSFDKGAMLVDIDTNDETGSEPGEAS